MIVRAIFLLLISVSLGSTIETEKHFPQSLQLLDADLATDSNPVVKRLLKYFEFCHKKDDKYLNILEKYSKLQEKYSEVQNKLIELNNKFNVLLSSNLEKDQEIKRLQDKIVPQFWNNVEVPKILIKLENSTNILSNNIENFPNQSTEELEISTEKTVSVPALSDRCPLTQNETDIIQEIQIPGSDPFKVICHSGGEEGAGWMVLSHKYTYSGTLNRTYEEHINGFGSVDKEFFIGLERLYLLTNRAPHEFMVVLYFEDYLFIKCENFVLGNASEGYMLKDIGECAGDVFFWKPIQGTKFSTYDLNQGDEDYTLMNGFGWWHSRNEIYMEILDIKIMIRRKD